MANLIYYDNEVVVNTGNDRSKKLEFKTKTHKGNLSSIVKVNLRKKTR